MAGIKHVECNAITSVPVSAEDKLQVVSGKSLRTTCKWCGATMRLTYDTSVPYELGTPLHLTGTTVDVDRERMMSALGCLLMAGVLLVVGYLGYLGFKAATENGDEEPDDLRYPDDEICRLLETDSATGVELVEALRDEGVEGSDLDIAAGLFLYVQQNCPEFSDDLADQ